jgi:prolyl-tRNA synthetase
MRRSNSFIKTRRDAPSDELSKNAQLLIRAGFIYKDSAGVYALLPLGLRVVENIKSIVREEMNDLGAAELLMTSLQRKEVWERTDRWDDEKVDVWFKSKLKNGTEVGLGWSHEEQITLMMKEFIASHRDLPAYVYQFQNKLRNEVRAKSGIMRAREFLMKDMYSYSRSEQEHQEFYDSVIKAYHRVYDRVGLGQVTYMTFASGGAFTQFSHEFQTVTEAGEDTIYLDKDKKIAVNQEVMSDEVLNQLGLKKEDLAEVKASEVGNIFNFGTKKSEQMGLSYTDEDGTQKSPVLGSYGIGVTRLMGVVVEHFSDDRGIIWPVNLAPYKIYLVAVGDSDDVKKLADELYASLKNESIEVIYDDRAASPGEKFADADLMGIPLRLVVSEKSLIAGGVEIKNRNQDNTEIIGHENVAAQVVDRLKSLV